MLWLSGGSIRYNDEGNWWSDWVSPSGGLLTSFGGEWVTLNQYLGYIQDYYNHLGNLSDDQRLGIIARGVVRGAGGIGDWRFIAGFYALSALGGYAVVDAGAAGLGEGADQITTLSRVYRVFGGDSGEFGMSWTPYNPSELPFYAQDAGLPVGNSAGFVIQGELPLGAQVGVRAALPYQGVGGGLTEFLIPNARSIIVWTRVTPF
jgi:hypothetical protein